MRYFRICPDALSAPGMEAVAVPVHLQKELNMNKWTIFQNSKVVRVTASAGTLVAVAAIVGAGFKWN